MQLAAPHKLTFSTHHAAGAECRYYAAARLCQSCPL